VSLLISASQVAGIIAISHHVLVKVDFFFLLAVLGFELRALCL
jgi:hypothetical protein